MNIWMKLGMGAVVLAVLFFLVKLYGSSQYKRGRADEKVAWTEVQVEAKGKELEQFKLGVASVLGAEKQYIETVREKIVPITTKIIERSTEYAQTPDGASLCLPAERVLMLEGTTGSLFDTLSTPTTGTEPAVPTDAVGEER